MDKGNRKIFHPGAQRWLGRTLLHLSTLPRKHRWSRVPTAVALDHSLSATDLRTLILLCRYTGAIGCCYVGQSTLAQLRGVTRQMIAKSLDRLRHRYWVTWEIMFRPNSKEQTSSWYTIHYKSMPDEPAD